MSECNAAEEEFIGQATAEDAQQKKQERYYYRIIMGGKCQLYDRTENGLHCGVALDEEFGQTCVKALNSTKLNSAAQHLVDKQANDEGLWCETKYAQEA